MPRIKINEQAAADMKEMRKKGASVKDIAAKYNIAVSTTFKLLQGIPLPKKVKEQRYCKYCGVKIEGGDLCSGCHYKLKLVRKLLALGQVIKKCADEERMLKENE